MLVKMKRREITCTDFAKRYSKAWDSFIIATDSYSAGYREGIVDLLSCIDGEEVVEVEIKDGLHQLSVRTFLEWEKQHKNLGFKESMTTFLLHFNISEIRVEEKDGTISFQGLAKRK